MDLTRRNFLNRSAVSLIGGIAISASTTSTFAAGDDSTPVVLPPLGGTRPAVPVTPSATVPTAPPAANQEGAYLGQAAIASAGFPLTAEDSAEVVNQLNAYPSSVKDLRVFPLVNGTAPSSSVTGAFGKNIPSSAVKVES